MYFKVYIERLIRLFKYSKFIITLIYYRYIRDLDFIDLYIRKSWFLLFSKT